MKTSKNKISFLIHQAILNRRLPDLEEKLFTDLLNYYVENNSGYDSVIEDDVISLLNNEVNEIQNRRNKLNNPKSFNTLGEYLKFYIEDNTIDKESFSQNCKIEPSLLSQFLDNKIKVINIGPKKIAQLVKYLNLKIEIVKELLIKTIWLNANNISIKETLARFDPKKGLNNKETSMSSGLKELLFKANKTKKLNQSPKDVEQIAKKFLDEFDNYYKTL